MLRSWIVELLLQAGEAAPGAAGGGEGGAQQGDPFGALRGLLFPMALVFFIFWFLVFRPESKKRKQRELMISAVKKGDRILTTSGMLGEVWRVDGNEIEVIIDKDRDVTARFTKTAILEIIPEDSGSGEDAAS